VPTLRSVSMLTCQVEVQLQRLEQVPMLPQPWCEVLHVLYVIRGELDGHLPVAACSNGSAQCFADAEQPAYLPRVPAYAGVPYDQLQRVRF
jgi:hypothetical protein